MAMSEVEPSRCSSFFSTVDPLASSAFDFNFRPRSHSEGALFQNSYDYTTPYEEHGGKNGADLALELLGAREAPFDKAGHLRAPAWVGTALSFPRVPGFLGGEASREPSDAARRSIANFGLVFDTTLQGIEEVISLGASTDRDPADYDDVPNPVDMVPRIISELVEDKLVPEEYADLPPAEIAKIFHINPRATPRNKPSEHTISYTINSEGRNIIEHATLAQVVKAFSSDAQDNTSIQRLVLAHEHFVESRVMFSQFVDFFGMHQSSSQSDQIIQARVLNVMKRWIEMSWADMRAKGLEPLLTDFMKTLNNGKLKSILEKAISQAERMAPVSVLDIVNTPPGSPAPLKPKRAKPKKGETWCLTDFEPLEIARQLSLIDFGLAQQVNLSEMLKAQWVDDGAPTLFAASKRVNDLTYWLALQVVSVPILKKRVKMITHIIKIAKHLLALNSLNSFMAVYLAFNLASTARLTNTWKNVPAKHFQVWKKISRTMSPMNNFGSYREHILTIQPPMVLCQEVLLKDLLYEEEGRPDFIADGIMDMTKMDEIGRIIETFRQARSKPYAIQPMPTLMEYLRDIPSWDSAEAAAQKLDGLSKEAEPSSINFPAGMGSDPASRVKSLGTLPTWRRDLDMPGADRLQHSNPKPSPRGREDPVPVSPRSASLAAKSPIPFDSSTPTSPSSSSATASPSTPHKGPGSPTKKAQRAAYRKTANFETKPSPKSNKSGKSMFRIDSSSAETLATQTDDDDSSTPRGASQPATPKM